MNSSSNAMALVMAAFDRYPLLTAAQEIALGRKVQAWQSCLADRPEDSILETWAAAVGLKPSELQKLVRQGERARDRLVLCNQRLVLSIAKRYQDRGLDLEDCFQWGCLGLIRAAEKFDPERGYRFTTYATYWVRQSISRGIQMDSRLVRLPAHVWEKLNACFRYCREHQLAIDGAAIGRAVTALDIPEKYRSLLERAIYPVLELNREVPGTHGVKLLDTLPNQEVDETRALALSEIVQVLQLLPDKQRDAIQLRWGLEDGRYRTLKQVGEQMELSRERVRQLEKRGLQRLQQLVNA